MMPEVANDLVWGDKMENFHQVPQYILSSALNRIVNNPITCMNFLPMKKQFLVNVEVVQLFWDLARARDIENNGTSLKEVIKFIASLVKAKSILQKYKHYVFLIKVGWLDNFKWLYRVVKLQATTSECIQISIAHQYIWHMMVEFLYS